MSEVSECPYCGATVHTERMMDYDSKIKLRCNNCGGFFEYMPGFGAFRLPEPERMSPTRYEGSAFRPHYEVYESEMPMDFEEAPVQESDCGTACFMLLCFCCLAPIFVVLMMLILGIGIFWF